MIRPATEDDIPALVEMGRAFHAAKQKRYPFVEKDTADFFRAMLAGTFIAPGGFIVGAVMGAPSNQSYRTAYELFWWAAKAGEGLRLLRRFEEWAKEQGCSDIILSHPEGERAGALMQRQGYQPDGRTLRKAI